MNAHITNSRGDKVILLLHGWMHSGARWQFLSETLSETLDESYRIIALDLPGFGLSANVQPTNGYTLDSLTDAVRAYITSHLSDVPIYAVVAHSMGGLITLNYCSRYSLIAPHLFLCDVPVEPTLSITVSSALRSLLFFGMKLNHILPQVITNPIVKLLCLPTVLHYSQIDDILVADIRLANPKAASELLYEISKFDIPEYNFLLPDAVVVSHGKHDRIASYKSAQLLCLKLDGYYVEFENASHTAQLEVKQKFNDIVKQFLLNPTSFINP
jgi:pimeloyl-ACP methyl ester carboxylesterase